AGARVHDVLDDQDVLAGDGGSHVEVEADPPAAVRAVTVTGDLEEVAADGDGQGADEVSQEDPGPLEDADEQGPPPGVVRGDEGGQLPDAAGDVRLGDQRFDVGRLRRHGFPPLAGAASGPYSGSICSKGPRG